MEKKINPPLEAKLQQAPKIEAVRDLADSIAHEFNEVLMGIRGCTSLMLVDIDPGHPHFEYLKKIEDMVQKGANLTGQLFGLGRGEGEFVEG
ncbi:MAG: hypothetical protein JRF30_07690, partial [Deltaproteobacteria bacterium]|nr:hypothetical protein [Deltaproteobacteria bacterium]MBW1796531.1 hypothetical protein [Deltaproteobacteria bacterium]MBW2330796.1 hypothetical protein [Deltaproteobacteria bacterium]